MTNVVTTGVGPADAPTEKIRSKKQKGIRNGNKTGRRKLKPSSAAVRARAHAGLETDHDTSQQTETSGGGDDDAILDLPVKALALTYKGAPKYVYLKANQPCKLVDVRMKRKSTNQGNDRIELKGHHIYTGKLYVDTIVGTVDVPVLKVRFAQYTLLDVDSDDGSVVLMDERGETKEDANLGRAPDCSGAFDAVGREVLRRHLEGEALDVVVRTALGRDVVVEVKAAEGDEAGS